MYLLEEIWSKIFSYLDEYTLQNVASLVCKDWLNVIRNDCKLSGHLTLKRFIYFADINSMLRNNWPKLKELQLIHLSDSYIKSGMKKLIASLPCLQKLYVDAMQCTWNIYCLAEIMQWISVAKELRFLKFKMRADQGNIPNNDKKELLQATLNVIKENFPVEAIIDINEVDAFNRIDPCPLIIKPKWDTPMLIDPTPDSRYIVDF